VLDGFDDETKQIAKIDEELAEQQLKERRKEKVNKFRIFAPEDIEDAKKQDKDTVVKKEMKVQTSSQHFQKGLMNHFLPFRFHLKHGCINPYFRSFDRV
jgi:hypothetical protein